jgi:hypothetical protein
MPYSLIDNKRIFWDVNSNLLNKDKEKSFIISRILEHGDMNDLDWLLSTYTEQEITQTICSSKAISRKTANFFKNIFHISDPIICLSDSYQKIHKELWMQ